MSDRATGIIKTIWRKFWFVFVGAALAWGSIGAVWFVKYRVDDKGPRKVWDKFRDAVGEARYEDAEKYVSPYTREWYRNLINTLREDSVKMPETLPPGKDLIPASITRSAATYYVVIEKNVPGKGPDKFIFEVYFVKDWWGRWKIRMF